MAIFRRYSKVAGLGHVHQRTVIIDFQNRLNFIRCVVLGSERGKSISDCLTPIYNMSNLVVDMNADASNVARVSDSFDARNKRLGIYQDRSLHLRFDQSVIRDNS